MPIPRRISQSALQAIQPAPERVERSGEYPIPRPLDFEDFDDLDDLPSLAPIQPAPALRLVPSRSGQMPAVRPPPMRPPEQPGPPPGGRMLETSFMEGDDAPLALELKALPSRGGVQTMAGEALPVQAAAPAARKVHPYAPHGAMPGVVAFAGYGIPPESLSGAASYALRVITRRHALRVDLKIAKMRRLPQREIELYEAAIRCADQPVLTKGIAVIAMSIVGVLGVIASVAAAVL